MRIDGKITYDANEIKKLIVDDVNKRFGVRAIPEDVWLGLKRAGEPEVESVIEVAYGYGINGKDRADGPPRPSSPPDHIPVG